MSTVVNHKPSQRRVVLVGAILLGALLAVAVKRQLTFAYLISRLVILFGVGFLLSRKGVSRTRALSSVVGLSVLEQAFMKTAAIWWVGPPSGVAGLSLLAL